MRPFTFNPGPKLLAGPDQAAALAERLPPGPCLFVTDKDLVRLGLTDAYREAIGATRELIVFDEVEADPSKETLLAATEAARLADVTCVVGFGGGSPMDVAKLGSYLVGSGDVLDEVWGVGLAKGRRLPLALVPTTAGTGSEATPISVITCEGGLKLAVNSAPLIADWAVLDATLTLGLPGHVTAATGIDAIVHAVEAYTSARLKNPLSDVLARVRPGAPAPVQAFVDKGVDFVSATTLRELVSAMNAIPDVTPLDYATVEAEVTARDREVANRFTKDTQVTAIRAARGYLGDRFTRVVAPHRLTDPKAGPLIAVKLHILTRKSLGGLETDLDSRVLRDDGGVFTGLYAAGEAAGFGGGGVHGYRSLEGTFLGGCVFSGRAAGRAAARDTA